MPAVSAPSGASGAGSAQPHPGSRTGTRARRPCRSGSRRCRRDRGPPRPSPRRPDRRSTRRSPGSPTRLGNGRLPGSSVKPRASDSRHRSYDPVPVRSRTVPGGCEPGQPPGFFATRTVMTDPRRDPALRRFDALAVGLAHELKNPLSTMRINLQLLREELGERPGARESGALKKVDAVLGEMRRLERIVADFLRIAREPALSLRPTDLNAIVEDTMSFLSGELRTLRIDSVL